MNADSEVVSEENEPTVEPVDVTPAPSQNAPHQNAGPQAPAPAARLSAGDERTWAMLAHLSVLLNLVTGFLGVAAALVIYLVYKDRSRYVAYQSMQAFLFQLIFWAGGGLLIGIMWAVVGALSAVLIGILLIPFAVVLTLVFLLMPLVALVYGVVGAVRSSNGEDFRYGLIGDWALNFV
ncbi:MAG: DUF4870 domain-containing protein [Anaerolineae bacterium]|nr:DUF4870 domain-containing protein [Anaerolineae bacterium]